MTQTATPANPEPAVAWPRPVPRRKYHVDGCSECASVAKAGGYGPAHQASPRCESGGHDHCSCDVCF